jgi:hypothetical protein
MWFVPDRWFTRWSLPPRRDRLLAQVLGGALAARVAGTALRARVAAPQEGEK